MQIIANDAARFASLLGDPSAENWQPAAAAAAAVGQFPIEPSICA